MTETPFGTASQDPTSTPFPGGFRDVGGEEYFDEVDEALLRPIADPVRTRESILSRTKSAFETKFPIENDKVRLEIDNLSYGKKQTFGIRETKDAVMAGKRLALPLHGDVRLVDKKSGEILDEKKHHLVANVPYLTDRGTFVMKGTEYVVVNQSRLRPGIYTRRKDNGELEAHINVKPGTGPGMRMFMEPDTGVYRVKVGNSQIKLLPILRRLGVSDDEIKASWGEEVFDANSNADDPKAFGKFYDKLVGARGAAFLRRLQEEGGNKTAGDEVDADYEDFATGLTEAMIGSEPESPEFLEIMRQYGFSTDDPNGDPKGFSFTKIEKAARVVVSGKDDDFKVNHKVLNQARQYVDQNPTEKQKRKGNYRMGHVRINGLDITIENPVGSYRRGTDRHGKEWKRLMKHDYGYVKKTLGKDGDHIDVFLGPDLDSETVFVVDQDNNGDGKFDEHKCMVGFKNRAEAKAAYLGNYQKSWKGFSSITPLTFDEFKWWCYNGDTARPMSDQQTPKIAEDFEGWVGFDLDGTLAESEDDFDPNSVGKPIKSMVELAQGLMNEGVKVKIVTARAADRSKIHVVEDWAAENFVGDVEVTNEKDPGMRCLFDDRVVQVAKNKGLPIKEREKYLEELKKEADWKMEDQTFSDGSGEYPVSKLYELAESLGRSPEDIPISELMTNLEPSPLEEGEELPGHPDFVARAEAADESYPGIAITYPDGVFLGDGVHRLWKRHDRGDETFPAYRLDSSELAQILDDQKGYGPSLKKEAAPSVVTRSQQQASDQLVQDLVMEGITGRELKSTARDFLDHYEDGSKVVDQSGVHEPFPIEAIERSIEKVAVVKIEDGKWVIHSGGEKTAAWSIATSIPRMSREEAAAVRPGYKWPRQSAADLLNPPNEKKVAVVKSDQIVGPDGSMQLHKFVANNPEGGMMGEVFARIDPNEDYINVQNLFVAPEHRENGVGRSLMEEVIGTYGKDRELRLRARPGHITQGSPEQSDLINFYSSLGFETYDEEGAMRRPMTGPGSSKAAQLLRNPHFHGGEKVLPQENFDIGDISAKLAAVLNGGKIESTEGLDEMLTDEDKADLVLQQLNRMEIDPEISTRNLGSDYSTLGAKPLLDTSAKLLRINRGEADPDDRDHRANQTYHSVDDFLEERITKDAGRVGRSLLGKAGYNGSLKGLKPGHFTSQLEGLIVSNSLSQAVPGINPIELYDIQQKITQTGEGGIPSRDAIPMEARNVHPSQLGVIDPIRTAESGMVGVDQRLGSFVRKGPNQQIYIPLIDKRTGKKVWRTPSQLYGKSMLFPGRVKMNNYYSPPPST